MDSVTVARSLRGSIGMLAMNWLVDADTLAKAEARGMPAGMAAYAAGRFGVLGDCPVDVVTGAAFFWYPNHVHQLLAEGRAAIAPAEAGRIYADICREWGEEKLGGFDGEARLGELLARVVEGAEPLGAPLFVGWRDHVDAPIGPGRTFQLAQAMRELRFCRHCIAVQAAAMSPLEAILSGPTGEWNARMFGWPEPYPDCSHLSEARDEIEAHTDRIHGADLEALSADEREELRDLAKAARIHAAVQA